MRENLKDFWKASNLSCPLHSAFSVSSKLPIFGLLHTPAARSMRVVKVGW